MKIQSPLRNTEKIESQGKPRLEGVERCKSMNKIFEVLIGKAYKEGNIEKEFFLRGLYGKYKQFHPKKIVQVNAKQWKGKSSMEVFRTLDGFGVRKFQKPAADEEPKEKVETFNEEEIKAMVDSISSFEIEYIPTEALSMVFSQRLGLGHDGWNTGNKQFFSDRHWHNRLTIMLNGIQEAGLIEYKGGRTKLLNKDISLQLVLNSLD